MASRREVLLKGGGVVSLILAGCTGEGRETPSIVCTGPSPRHGEWVDEDTYELQVTNTLEDSFARGIIYLTLYDEQENELLTDQEEVTVDYEETKVVTFDVDRAMAKAESRRKGGNGTIADVDVSVRQDCSNRP